MHIFNNYDNVFTISLIFPEENISETSASTGKLIDFIKFYLKMYDIFGLNLYVIITSEYTQIAPNYIIYKKLPRKTP